jgi:lipoyl(octanoyl) transferase
VETAAATKSGVWVVSCGRVPYTQAREAQSRLAASRRAGEVPDLLLLLEHPPVYTRGRRSLPEELPMGEDWYRAQGIEVCDTDRGGAVTYHGPGQLVGYPIVDLNALRNRPAPGSGAEDTARMDVVAYVRGLERVMIEALGEHGVAAGLREGLTGVWTRTTNRDTPGSGAEDVARKIGSIGVHISRGVTTHGFAINVNNDLQPFEWIVPCGIEGVRITSMARELGAEQDFRGFADTVAERFGDVYERQPRAVDADELATRIGGIEAIGAGLAGAQPAVR